MQQKQKIILFSYMSSLYLSNQDSYWSAEYEKGIKNLFDQLCQDGKRVSVIDYPLR